MDKRAAGLGYTLGGSQRRANTVLRPLTAYADLLGRIITEHLLQDGHALGRQLPGFSDLGPSIHGDERVAPTSAGRRLNDHPGELAARVGRDDLRASPMFALSSRCGQ